MGKFTISLSLVHQSGRMKYADEICANRSLPFINRTNAKGRNSEKQMKKRSSERLVLSLCFLYEAVPLGSSNGIFVSNFEQFIAKLLLKFLTLFMDVNTRRVKAW